jgi:hypothetical protein
MLLPDGLPRFGIPLPELRKGVAQRSPQPLVDHLGQGSSNEEGLQHVAAFLSYSECKTRASQLIESRVFALCDGQASWRRHQLSHH